MFGKGLRGQQRGVEDKELQSYQEKRPCRGIYRNLLLPSNFTACFPSPSLPPLLFPLLAYFCLVRMICWPLYAPSSTCRKTLSLTRRDSSSASPSDSLFSSPPSTSLSPPPSP
eukprot:759928-Hanusia_phi.AAC.1